MTWSLVDTETSTADHASDEEGTLSFTEGEASKTITYLSEQDELHEGDESFDYKFTGRDVDAVNIGKTVGENC